MIRFLGPEVDLDGLVADAVEEGREVRVVHAGPTKELTLEAFAEALDFPGWFGHNLDALSDCLEYLARTATGEWEIVVDDIAELGRADWVAMAGIRGVLGELVLKYPTINVTYIER